MYQYIQQKHIFKRLILFSNWKKKTREELYAWGHAHVLNSFGRCDLHDCGRFNVYNNDVEKKQTFFRNWHFFLSSLTPLLIKVSSEIERKQLIIIIMIIIIYKKENFTFFESSKRPFCKETRFSSFFGWQNCAKSCHVVNELVFW